MAGYSIRESAKRLASEIETEKVLMRKNGRFTVFAALAALWVVAPIGSAFGQGKTIQQLFRESEKLYEAQQFEEALKGFEAIVRKEPRFAHARSYAAKCREAIAAGARPTRSLEGQLAQITLDNVEFVEADLASVFEYLSLRSEELSGGKVVPNFIYKGSDEQKRKTTVTLKLRNIPLTRVIDYVGQLTGIRFTYDEFAVVASPPVGSTQPKPAPEGGAKKDEISKKFD
jgi:hypothetical protein